MTDNSHAMDIIRSNITEHGYHIYAVSGGPHPRFIYTIGNTNKVGFEFICAGMGFYTARELVQTIKEIVDVLVDSSDRKPRKPFVVSSGLFRLRPVHLSWVQELMLGALDYYGEEPITAFQIVPDDAHYTIDIPDMSHTLSTERALAWRWLSEAWPYSVREDSIAMTNLAALRGDTITHAARWEETNWEMFAGAGATVRSDEARPVALGTLLSFDPSLEPAVSLEIGEGMIRKGRDKPWEAWNE